MTLTAVITKPPEDIVVAKQLLDATAVNTATVYTYTYGQKLYRIQICVSITPINLSKDKNKHSQVMCLFCLI